MKRQLSVADVISLVSVRPSGLMASQTPDDIRLLAENIRNIHDGGTYCEIGTRDGYSTLAALLANFRIDVYGVDIDEKCGDRVIGFIEEVTSLATRGNYYKTEDWDLQGRFHFLHGDSVEVSKQWDKPIDFLFIDGDHSEEGCSSDARAWMPFLRNGSLVGFHDYIFWEHENMKVKTAVDKIIQSNNEYYFVGASEQIALFRKY